MPTRLLQTALLVAAAGAVAAMLGPFSTVVELVGVGLIVLGTVLSAPAARESGEGWWANLASGAGVTAAGLVLSLLSDTLGGLLTLLGAVVVLVVAVLALPSE